jgi:oligoendopeptidase F
MDSRLMLWDQYMHKPGYGSGYLVGWAAAPKLLEKLEADPVAFQKTYRAVLEQGDSLTAEKFLQAFGIEIQQPTFWKDRLGKMAKDVEKLNHYRLASVGSSST